MRISKMIALIVLTVAAIVIINAGLTFALEPYGSKSEVMWHDYVAETQDGEQFDTIYVGTSVAKRSFIPSVIDNAYGSNSFNLSSPSQSVEETLVAIQTAYEDHHVKHVVFGLMFTALQNDSPSLNSAFLKQRTQAVGTSGWLETGAWLVTQKGAATNAGSINWLFPWTSNHVKIKPHDITKNMRMRLDGTSLYDAAVGQEPNWIYYGRGSGNYDRYLDYDDGRGAKFVALFGEAEHIESTGIDPDRVQTLREICAYCDERDIELTVIGVPIPVFNIMSYGDVYHDNQAYLASVLAECGVPYYDFNYARPELFESEHGYFYDNAHLNDKGAHAFSSACVDLLEKLDAGEDVSGLFYTVPEYIETLDYIDALMVDAYAVDDGIKVEMTPCAGPNVCCEYQVFVEPVGLEEDDWVLASDWSRDTERVVQTDLRGPVYVRATVREAGSDAEWEHAQTDRLYY